MEKIIGVHKITFNESLKKHYIRLIHRGLDKKISNIREAKRIINKLNFDYGCLTGEVNIIDLLALIILKIYANNVYKFIDRNKGICLGTIDNYINNKTDAYKTFKDSLTPDDEWAIDILEEILPTLRGQSFDMAHLAL